MNDSIKRTLLVTLSVCLICSLFVSITAVSLRSTQETNKLNDQRIKILEAAKIYDPTTSIEDQFDNLEIKFLDFENSIRLIKLKSGLNAKVLLVLLNL